jgi:ATP-dependent RNA helicase DDX56/DBP9
MQCVPFSKHTHSGPGIERLQQLLLTDPAIVSVPIHAQPPHCGDADGDADGEDGHMHGGARVAAPSTVVHTILRCPPSDKLLYVLALLRLGKVKRKALVFAANPNSAVRLRLFLERFGVRCATAHGELPAASRQLALAQFNRGLFDFLIVADDDAKHRAKAERLAAAAGDDDVENEDEEGPSGAAAETATDTAAPSDPPGSAAAAGQRRGKKGGGLARDAEYGLVRGIDFKDVRTVINLDVPPDAASYVHRVGRCARGPGGRGMALTLCSAGEDETRLEAIAAALTTTSAVAEDGGDEPPGFAFQAADVISGDAVEALRYRAEDALRGLGASAVREARLRELRSSLLGSERLAAHFEAHPHDRRLLQADAPLSKTPNAPHLKHLPSYLRTGGPIKGHGGGASGAAARKREEQRKKPAQRLDTSDVAAAAGATSSGAAGAAPLAEASTLSKLLWAKDDGAKVSRKRKAKELAGPEWPQQRKALAHQRTKRNVRRGRRKTDR